MALEDTIRRIREIGIVPVVRAANLDEARQAINAICRGGIPIIEVTMTVPNAPAMIRELVQHYGDQVLTGAGTVTTARQAEVCLEVGVQFLVGHGDPHSFPKRPPSPCSCARTCSSTCT